MLSEYGKLNRTFTLATLHYGGRRIAVKDHRKHVTAGIAASASGFLAPLFSIASGKSNIKVVGAFPGKLIPISGWVIELAHENRLVPALHSNMYDFKWLN